MVNFRIIEGDDLFESVHDEFLHLYNNGVTAKTIMKKLGLTKSQYQNFKIRLKRRNEITLRNPNAGKKKQKHHSRLNPKNYYFNRGSDRWYVMHSGTYYACFFTEPQAQRFVELMRECDWDKSKREDLKWKAIRERPLKKGVVMNE